MSSPAYPVVCPKGAYTKVATGVVTGVLHNKKTDAIYLQTYRVTGEAAPTDRAEAVRMFIDNPEEEVISAKEPIDVYVWCDNDDGILRADL